MTAGSPGGPAAGRAASTAPRRAGHARARGRGARRVDGAGQSALGSAANRNFISNAGFVVTNDGVVVIDALGSPALAEELLAQIRRITPLPVTHVIITHYHADHIYGLQAFKAAGATVIAQRAAGEYLNSETAAQRPLKVSRGRSSPGSTRTRGSCRRIAGSTARPRSRSAAWSSACNRWALARPRIWWSTCPAARAVRRRPVFRGRVPFVGQADSRRHWIAALDSLLGLRHRRGGARHGPASTSARADLQLTRDYLAHLRLTMGEAARNMEPLRGGVCEGRLVALRQAAAVPGRQSHQRLQHLSADGARGEVKRSRRAFLACGRSLHGWRGPAAPAAPGENSCAGRR